MKTPSNIQDTADERADPRHFCQFCGEAIALNRLICAPKDAALCIRRQEEEAEAMSQRYVVTPAGVAALEASRKRVA